MFGFPNEDIFLTPFVVYIFSHQHTYYKLQSFTTYSQIENYTRLILPYLIAGDSSAPL